MAGSVTMGSCRHGRDGQRHNAPRGMAASLLRQILDQLLARQDMSELTDLGGHRA
jgi:hypothetical protein